jgi:hypothetical protein
MGEALGVSVFSMEQTLGDIKFSKGAVDIIIPTSPVSHVFPCLLITVLVQSKMLPVVSFLLLECCHGHLGGYAGAR